MQKNKKEHCENFIINCENILSYLKKINQPINRVELAQKLNLTNVKQSKALRSCLRTMERNNQLIFTRNQNYVLTENSDILHGKVIGHRDGYGFLSILNQKDDIYLSQEQMKTCIHGDIVLAQILISNRYGKREARIIKVVKPRNNNIIGRYYKESGIGFVIPNDNHFNFKILISSENSMKNVKIGYVVIIKLIQRPINNLKAVGKIIEILGHNMGTKLAINISLLTHEIPHIWPCSVKKEIIKINTDFKNISDKNRIDLRKLPFVTIDDEDACDLDDAVYCEKKSDDSWRLLVAIADVSYYVRPNSAIDKEASSRGNSVYFPCKIVIPMLPEILSNNICSLHPKLDRLCLVCDITISSKGTIVNFKHYEAIINSYAKLTYNKVWKILQRDISLCKQYNKLVMHLNELYNMYYVLKKSRNQRGGLSFDKEEIKFIFNKNNCIEKIEKIHRNDVHKIIEECMILANIASVNFIEKYAEPILFRDHDPPTIDSIINFRTILNELGLSLSGGNKPKPIDYLKLLTKINNRTDSDMIQIMLLRSMKQAVYDIKNRGHFGLALNSYAHFTSPIRRYSDLLLHRAIKYLILVEKGYIYDEKKILTGEYHYDTSYIANLANHCSMTERRADLATRDVSDWLKCEFMQNKLGNVFQGIISNVTNFGFFVKLKDLLIEGLVHISSLSNDYYHFDNVIQRLTGKSTNIIYKIGDIVTIKVVSVRIDERKIDFELIENTKYLLENSNKKLKYYKKYKLLKSKKRSNNLNSIKINKII